MQEGDYIEKGEFILDGNPAPHDILAIKGVEELASYLVNEIQEVYRLQGVSINDKHIEVIVRQMLQKVEDRPIRRIDPAAGRAARCHRARRDERQARGGRPQAGDRDSGAARHHQGVAADPVLHLGRLVPGDDPGSDRGFGSGKVDTLEGLKENVIVGRLIPAGTGGMLSRFKQVAEKRDNLILEEQAKQSGEALPAAPAAE